MAIRSFCIVSSKSYIITILIVIITFSLSCEFFIREYLINIPRSIPNFVNLLYTSQNPNIVIGDSHIYRGFISQNKFLNLGRKGTPIPAVEITLNNYQKKVKLKKVILEASPQLFSNAQLDRQSLGYEDYFKFINFLVQPYIFDTGFTQYFASIKNFSDIKTILNKEWPVDIKRNNAVWMSFTDKERQKKAKKRTIHHLPNMKDRRTKEYKVIYEKMIKKLLENQAKICLIRTPINNDYLNIIKNDINYNEAISFFLDISEKYKINYVDFRDLDMLFDNSLFINQDHITSQASSFYAKATIKACFQ